MRGKSNYGDIIWIEIMCSRLLSPEVCDAPVCLYILPQPPEIKSVLTCNWQSGAIASIVSSIVR